MDSPHTLELVFTSTGQPDFRSNAESGAWWHGLVSMRGLCAGPVVNIRNARNLRARDLELVDPKELLLLARHFAAPRLHRVGDQQHVRAVAVHLDSTDDFGA